MIVCVGLTYRMIYVRLQRGFEEHSHTQTEHVDTRCHSRPRMYIIEARMWLDGSVYISMCVHYLPMQRFSGFVQVQNWYMHFPGIGLTPIYW